MWTFTRHESPQRTGDIMRHAWRIRKAEGIPFGPALKRAWASARERAGPLLPTPPPTLMQFIRGRGGLRPTPDLRRFGAPLYILHRNGLPLDFAARLATDAGYPVRDCVNTLLDCLADECSGRRIFAMHEQHLAAEIDAWRAHHDAIMSDEPPF